MLPDVERIAEAGFVPPVAEMRALIGPRTRAVVPVSPAIPPAPLTRPSCRPPSRDLAQDAGFALLVDETDRTSCPTAMSSRTTFRHRRVA